MVLRFSGLFALTLAVTLAGSLSADGTQPRRQESAIFRAVFADGQLWLLSDAGVLASIAESKDDRVEVILPEPALDLWVQDGQPAVITCPRTDCSDWVLRWRSSNGDWNVKARVASLGDHFVAIASTAGTITVLTHQRIVDVVGDKQNTIALSAPLRPRPIASMHVTPTSVFVGFNAGEWGGGLQRIDRSTGEVTSIERNESGKLCGGPLNTACDPVNGITTAPWNPDCVVVAIGLVHFAPKGRIVEVCGHAIRRLYSKSHPWPPYFNSSPALPSDLGADRQRDGSFPSVAFFGLAHDGDVLLAVGIDGIYRIEPDGTARSDPLPKFKQVGAFFVNFDLPRFVLVLTDVNRRRSVSGSVPIIVPR